MKDCQGKDNKKRNPNEENAEEAVGDENDNNEKSDIQEAHSAFTNNTGVLQKGQVQTK